MVEKMPQSLGILRRKFPHFGHIFISGAAIGSAAFQQGDTRSSPCNPEPSEHHGRVRGDGGHQIAHIQLAQLLASGCREVTLIRTWSTSSLKRTPLTTTFFAWCTDGLKNRAPSNGYCSLPEGFVAAALREDEEVAWVSDTMG